MNYDEGSFQHAKRPEVEADVNGQKLKCLVDTGASISVISEKYFNSLWQNWTLHRLPMPSSLRVTGITGHTIKIVDYVLLEMKVLGKTLRRPMLVVSGLDHTQAVLGWDTVKEEGLVIDGQQNQVHFSTKEKVGQWSVAALQTARRQKIMPWSIHKVYAVPTVGDKVLPAGAEGICEVDPTATLGLWDNLNRVNDDGEVLLSIVNTTDRELELKPGDIVGSMSNPEFFEETVRPLTDETLASIFGTIGKEPNEPKKGLLTQPTAEQKKVLEEKLHIEAPEQWRGHYKDLLLRYHDVISTDKFDLGWTDVIQHKIHMKDQVPVHSRQFRIPFEHEETVHQYVRELLKKGAIEVSRSPYNSPIFCVTKKPLPDAEPDDPLPLRCVLDYRAINAKSMPDRYCMREVRECIDEVGRRGSSIFSTVDLTSGFWQQSLAEESRQYTAFTVPGLGMRYQWKVAPMGLQGSPASFARLMDYIMRSLAGVITYIDDLLVHSGSHQEHLRHLEAVLLRFRKYGLKINANKSIWGAKEVQYLGYTLKPEGVSPSKDKMMAIRDFKPPTSPKQIREFVGVCNYFRFLVRDFSRKAAPLLKLTKASEKWRGGTLPPEALKAFEALKADLVSEPVVAHPRRGRPFILHTDGAAGDAVHPGGLGAVLLQEAEDGRERVIAYASRGLKSHERNYSAYLLELTAAVFGIEHFDTYLVGKRFTLYTDHKPMEKLGEVHKKTLNRLQELMLAYDFTLLYRRGKDNAVADFLSRNVVAALSDVTDAEESVEQAQLRDAKVADIRRFLTTGVLPTGDRGHAMWVKNIAKSCFVEDGLVWHKSCRPGYRDKVLLYAPESVRNRIIQAAHLTREAGHGGTARTANRVMLSYWWPGIHRQVEDFAKACSRCLTAKSTLPPPADLRPLPIPMEPNERVHMDLYTDLKTQDSGNKHILVITDAFSKYVEMVAIESKHAEVIARAVFERWICRFGVPETLISDQGKEFDNKVIDELCSIFGTKKVRTSGYHPECNAQAEVYNKTIKNYMRAMLDNETTLQWETFLPSLALAYNTHVHRSTKESPFYLTFLHDPRLPWFDIEKPKQYYSYSYAAGAFRSVQTTFKLVRDNMEEASKKREEYYNRKSQERSFAPGDRVLVYYPNPPPGVVAKFFKRWRFMTVLKLVGPVNIMVREKPGEKPVIVHVNRAKHASEEEIKAATDTMACPYEGQDVNMQGRMLRSRRVQEEFPEEAECAPSTFETRWRDSRNADVDEDFVNEPGNEDDPDSTNNSHFESAEESDDEVTFKNAGEAGWSWITDFARGYFPGAARKADEERQEERLRESSPTPAAARRSARLRGESVEEDPDNKVFVPTLPLEYKRKKK